jgi:hypothetical protein
MRDLKTGRFLPIPKGQKTDKMRKIEKRLGCKLEDDYDEHYIKKGCSQRQLAYRCRHPRHLIFHSNHRGDRSQSWVSKLGLPKKTKHSAALAGTNKAKFRCEVCGNDEAKPHNAHWIANKDGGGTQRFNIIRLCPNHHHLLDSGDPAVTARSQEILLFRESKRIIETGPDTPEKLKDLLRVSRAIITKEVG